MLTCKEQQLEASFPAIPMSKLLAVFVTCISLSALAECDWSTPGQDPYTGRPDKAVHALKDMPWFARHVLAQRVGRSPPDDVIEIGKAKITGEKWTYANEIRNMHFGSEGKVCPSVSREGWDDAHVELASVWCTRKMLSEARHCVARPDVCGNYFQVTQVGARASVLPQPRQLPEPGSLALAGLALAGMAFATRKK